MPAWLLAVLVLACALSAAGAVSAYASGQPVSAVVCCALAVVSVGLAWVGRG